MMNNDTIIWKHFFSLFSVFYTSSIRFEQNEKWHSMFKSRWRKMIDVNLVEFRFDEVDWKKIPMYIYSSFDFLVYLLNHFPYSYSMHICILNDQSLNLNTNEGIWGVFLYKRMSSRSFPVLICAVDVSILNFDRMREREREREREFLLFHYTHKTMPESGALLSSSSSNRHKKSVNNE